MPPANYTDMKVEELETEVKRRNLLLQLRITESLSVENQWIDPREPLYDEPGFWSPLSGALPGNLNNQGRGEYLPIYLNTLGLKEVRDQSRWLCAYNEFAMNAVNNRIAYVVGTGLKYSVVRRFDDPDTPEDDTGGRDMLTEQAQAVVDQFVDDNDWHELEAEIVRRCDRDGEVFLRFFVRRRGGLAIRVIEPEFIVESGGDAKNSFGVVTDPDDVQHVRGYNVVENPGQGSAPIFVPVHEILHIKAPNSDRTHKRGLPIFFPVRKNLERVEKLLRNMSVLAQVQSTYAVIRKHTGVSAAAVRDFASALTDTTYQDRATGRSNSISQLKPGSIIDTTANSEYDFPSASVNAAQYVEIIQADLRAVAACLGFPEFMISAKSDGTNFASALVAEAPHVKQMERLQQYYARKFGEGVFRNTQHQPVMWRVLVMAVRMGKLPRQALHECAIQVECPRLTSRDQNSDTNRYATLAQNKVISKATWAAREDLDYEQEQRNMAEEEPDPQQQGPVQGGAPGGGPDDGGQGGAPDSPDGQQPPDDGQDGDMPSDEQLDALLAQLQGESGSQGQGGAPTQGGTLPAQDSVAGVKRPSTGLARGKRPGTVEEALTEQSTLSPDKVEPATPDPLPIQQQPHREVTDVVRDEEGNIARTIKDIMPLPAEASTP